MRARLAFGATSFIGQLLLPLCIMAVVPKFDLLTDDIPLLKDQLDRHLLSSVDLVQAYIDQIQRHDGYLHAMLDVAPTSLLLEKAKSLDVERYAGKIRGPLHGIPIIVKVCFL